MKQLKQPQRLKQQLYAREMEVFEDAPVADLDTPVAGEEIGLKFLKTKDLMRQKRATTRRSHPDPVEIPEEEMQVGDIQDESQDESR
jgi:hypothetical protein